MDNVYVTPCKYYTVHNKKKKAIQARSVMACCFVVLPWYLV